MEKRREGKKRKVKERESMRWRKVEAGGCMRRGERGSERKRDREEDDR